MSSGKPEVTVQIIIQWIQWSLESLHVCGPVSLAEPPRLSIDSCLCSTLKLLDLYQYNQKEEHLSRSVSLSSLSYILTKDGSRVLGGIQVNSGSICRPMSK